MRCSAAMRRIQRSDLTVMSLLSSFVTARRQKPPTPVAAPPPVRSPRLTRSRVLDDDVREPGREILGALGDEHGGSARDLLVDRGDPAVGIGDDRRTPRIRLLADMDVERQ